VSLALDAESLIKDLTATNADAVQLATLVSLASRIEPELLRAARIEMLSSADASAEADLWLSSLMSSRGALFAVMRPTVADTLRAWLGADPKRLGEAWRVLSRIHSTAPAALRAEEEITWRVLANPDDPEILRLFESVALAMETGRSGLAKWAARALPRLPAQARQSGGAWRVAQKASEMLGGPPILAAELTSSLVSTAASSFPVEKLPKISVGLRLFENALHISEPPEKSSERLEIPGTTPLVLELEWAQDPTRIERRTVSFGPGSTQVVHPIDSGTLKITTAARDVYTVHVLAESWKRQEYTTLAMQGGFAVRLYRGDATVLIALDVEPSRTTNLAGFEILRQAPGEAQLEPLKRFDASGKTPLGPLAIQRFRWVDRLPDNTVGQYKYQVSALHSDVDVPDTRTVLQNAIDLSPATGAMEIGFTRGMLEAGQPAPLRPGRRGSDLDFDTRPYAQTYELLGGSAHRLMMGFIGECLNNLNSTLDVIAFDFEHPDILRSFERIGRRLRIVLDDSLAHRRRSDLEDRLKRAGCAVFRTHFKRYSHSKVLIQSLNGTPSAVLTGSTNFSINSLYAQHNHVIVIRDKQTASLYEDYFQEARSGRKAAARTHKWVAIEQPGLPAMRVLICPSYDLQAAVVSAVENARRSIFYSLSDASRGLLGEINARRPSKSRPLLVGGVVHSGAGQRVMWHGNELLIRPDSMRRWLTGTAGGAPTGNGKFVVVDFDTPDAVVYAGSSTFPDRSDMNGDDVLEIRDPSIATQFAIEALRTIDHYRFRSALVQKSREATPHSGLERNWLRPYYSPKDPHFWERTILANVEWPKQATVPDERSASRQRSPQPSPKKSTATIKKSSRASGSQVSEKRSTTTSRKSSSLRKKK
jgi:hypothetical protein